MVPPNSDRVSRAPPYSGYHYPYLLLLIRDYHPLWLTFPGYSNSIRIKYRGPTTPTGTPVGLASSAFARHYLRNHFCFLLLRLLRCFSSAGLPIYRCDMSSTCRVAPFRYLRINSCVPIPVAFRSLSRPSSPLRA